MLSSPVLRKLAILALYGVVGVLVQRGYLPPEVKTWLGEHGLEVLALAMGVGHVLPEAASKPKGDAQ
jgi:hypothetical protein